MTWHGTNDERLLTLELRHTDRHTVERPDFDAKAHRDVTHLLPDHEKRILKQWLAARYGRVAFPDAFEQRLRRKTLGKTTVEREIGKILVPEARHLLGLFFDLGDQRHTEANEGEPYALRVSVVYDAVEGAVQARKSAERVADKLRALFDRTYGTPDVAAAIALEACEAIADTHMTLADLRRVDQWRLEYISLQDNESGDFLATGEAPS